MLSTSKNIILFPTTSIGSNHPYKNISDYDQIKPMDDNDLKHGHARYTAIEKNPRPANENFDEKWYLLMREGLYRAEVEKALSEIYQYFLGYSTEIEIIKDKNNYFVASRGIKNFIPWDTALFSGEIVLLEDDKIAYSKDTSKRPITGLGAVCALCDFFGDTDDNGSNFGIQTHLARAYKIDNEKALSFDVDEPEEEKKSIEQSISQDTKLYLKKDITQAEWFRTEKTEMLKKITETDFSIIEAFIKKNISSNLLEASQWLIKHLMSTDAISKEDGEETLTSLLSQDQNQFSIQSISDILQKKHEELGKEFGFVKRYTK